MSDLELQAVLRGVMEQALARLLALDPAAPARLAALAGKTLRIDSTQPPFTLGLRPTADGELLLEGDIDAPSTTLTGPAGALLDLLLAEDPNAQLQRGAVTLSGESQWLAELFAVFADLDPDWEGLLAHYLGELPAHQLGRGLDASRQWWQRARQRLPAIIREGLQEELRLLPSRAEVEVLRRETEALALRADRLQARLALLNATPPPERD